MTKATDTIEAPDLERIRAFRPDVLIRLGFRILRGGILTAAPHGVWSYHHGDNDRYRGGPPGFWEVMEGTPVTGTILQRLTEALDGGQVLYRSWGATNLFSVSRGRVEACWKGSEFLVRALRMLRDGTLSCPQREKGAAPERAPTVRRARQWRNGRRDDADFAPEARREVALRDVARPVVHGVPASTRPA